MYLSVREQMQDMGAGELRGLIRDVGALLRQREIEEKERRRRERIARLGEGGVWLEHELVNCGNCRRCQTGGYHHGPYWYLYEYTNGKMRSHYVGRRLKEEIAAKVGQEDLSCSTPEEAYPEAYEGN